MAAAKGPMTGADEATPIGAQIPLTNRTIDLAFGSNRAMNGVAGQVVGFNVECHV